MSSALADATRRDVVQRRWDRQRRRELAAGLSVSRQAVVKHVSTLGAAGLVAPQRSVREVRYSVTPAPFEDAVDWITTVGAKWDARLVSLRDQF